MNLADLLRTIRLREGQSVRSLARLAGVSPATVDRVEHGRVGVATSVEKMLDALGYHLVAACRPATEAPLTREDRRSLALHRAVARKLLDDPVRVRKIAHTNPQRMRGAATDARSASYFESWDALLARPEHELLSILLNRGEHARSLRQCSPFAGVLTDDERRQAFELARNDAPRAA